MTGIRKKPKYSQSQKLDRMTRGEKKNVGFVRVILTFVAFVTALPLVTRMMGEAWEQEQLVYQVSFAISDLPGFHIDHVVLVSAGIVLGVLTVFSLDEYKQVQRVVLAAGVPLFAVTLYVLELWIHTIFWADHWIALPVGFLIGVAFSLIGGTKSTRTGGRRTFPNAARLLYIVVTLPLIVGVLERHLQYQSPLLSRGPDIGESIVIQWPTVPVPLIDVWTPIYFLASLALFVVVGLFVSYTDRRDVAILAPPTDTNRVTTALLAELYGAALNAINYEEVEPTSSGEVFTESRILDTIDELVETTHRDSDVGFQFVRNNPFSKRRIVEYSDVPLPFEADLRELERRHDESSDTFRAIAGLKEVVSDALPSRIRNSLGGRSNHRLDRLEAAQAILLVVPSTDVFDKDENTNTTEPTYLDTFRRIYDIYERSDSHDVFFVLTEASVAMDAYEQQNGFSILYSDDEFRTFIRAEVHEMAATNDAIIPVNSSFEDNRESKGYTEVLDRL